MNTAIFAVGLIILAILLSIIFLYPIIGLVMMAFFIPMEVLTVIGSPGHMTVIKILGIYTFFCWLVRQKGTIRKPIKIDNIFWFGLAFLGWAAMSLCWSRYPEISLHKLYTLIQVIGLFILSIGLINSEKRFNWIIFAFIAGALTCGIWAWKIQRITPHFRLALEGQNPNSVGVITAIAILLLVNYLYNYQSKIFLCKLALYPILISLLFILIFSQSRGAWIGLVLSFGAYFFAFSSEKKNIKQMLLQLSLLSIVIIISLTLIPHLMPAKTSLLEDRFQSIFDPMQSTGRRFQIWKVAFVMCKENPLLGVGLNNFHMMYDKYLAITPDNQYFFHGHRIDPHNVYVAVITELGMIGFLIWGALLFSFFKMIKDGGQYKPLMLALFILLLIVSIKGTYVYDKFYWLILSLIAVSSSFKVEAKSKIKSQEYYVRLKNRRLDTSRLIKFS